MLLVLQGGGGSTGLNSLCWDPIQVVIGTVGTTKLGADHPSMLTSMGNLASTYRTRAGGMRP